MRAGAALQVMKIAAGWENIVFRCTVQLQRWLSAPQFKDELQNSQQSSNSLHFTTKRELDRMEDKTVYNMKLQLHSHETTNHRGGRGSEGWMKKLKVNTV